MKWAYYVKYKLKAATLLFIILCTVLLTNFWERNNYSKLDKSVSSIYKDRLLPATYLFQLSEHLYKKRILQEQYGINTSAGQQQHDLAINLLIKNYEATYLTDVEKQQWLTFKEHLATYNANGENIANSQILQPQFEQTLYDLNELNNTQALEGGQLQQSSKGILINGAFSSQIEIVLIILLGLFTLILLSVSDQKIFKQEKQNYLLN